MADKRRKTDIGATDYYVKYAANEIANACGSIIEPAETVHCATRAASADPWVEFDWSWVPDGAGVTLTVTSRALMPYAVSVGGDESSQAVAYARATKHYDTPVECAADVTFVGLSRSGRAADLAHAIGVGLSRSVPPELVERADMETDLLYIESCGLDGGDAIDDDTIRSYAVRLHKSDDYVRDLFRYQALRYGGAAKM